MHFNISVRLISGFALLLYAILTFVLLRFLVRNLLFSVALCLIGGLLAYAVWRVFADTGAQQRRGYWYMGAGLLAFAAAVVYFFVAAVASFWTLALFILLSALYVLAASQLRKRYWAGGRHNIVQASGQTAHFRDPYLIINPKSGNGRATKAHISELAQQQGIHAVTLQKGDDVESVARKAVQSGADVLGISGGDGSIGAVAAVALEYNLPMVVLPGGTRCHFARDIGLDPDHITDALVGFQGVERRVDVGDLNGRIVLNNASFGLYADIVDHPAYREHKLRITRDVLQSLTAGAQPAYDLQFMHGKQRFKRAVLVFVGINRYETFSLFELGRREALDDGILQITVATELNDSMVVRLLTTTSSSMLHHRTDPTGFTQWETVLFRITNMAGKLVAGVDGEREEYMAPVVVRLLPKALRLYVPAAGARSRPERTFAGETAKQLWRGATHGHPTT